MPYLLNNAFWFIKIATRCWAANQILMVDFFIDKIMIFYVESLKSFNAVFCQYSFAQAKVAS